MDDTTGLGEAMERSHNRDQIETLKDQVMIQRAAINSLEDELRTLRAQLIRLTRIVAKLYNERKPT